MSTASPGELMWQDLDRRIAAQEPTDEGVWTNLKDTSNLSNYVPIQIGGVVHEKLESQRDGVYYMLNNPAAGTYLKLDEKDFYILSLMDGTRTVKQLVVAYFSEFGTIAFGRINDLVAQLRASSFLQDPPVDVYMEAHVRARRKGVGYWGENILRGFLQKEVAIGGIDGILTNLYRRFFWVFFSRPAMVLYPPIVIVGLILFLLTVHGGEYSLFRTGGSVLLGLLTFLGANFIVIAVHESAHAFAAKSCGRKVRRGASLFTLAAPRSS